MLLCEGVFRSFKTRLRFQYFYTVKMQKKCYVKEFYVATPLSHFLHRKNVNNVNRDPTLCTLSVDCCKLLLLCQKCIEGVLIMVLCVCYV